MYRKETEQFKLTEFPILQDTCYLDHAGATLYAKSQITAVYKELNQTLFGNPHSLNLSSRHSTDIIDQVRFRILNHFHTNPDEYSVIFTSSATAALKLVAETFRWKRNSYNNSWSSDGTSISNAQFHINQDNCGPPLASSSAVNESCHCEIITSEDQKNNEGGSFVYLQDNHTSVLGMRELAAQQGACIHYMTHEFAFSEFERKEVKSQKHDILMRNSLFVYPAQSNFSGVKYPLSWIDKIQSGILNCGNSTCCHNSKWFCFLDAASYVSTNDLDLSVVKPDFVCISFYKIFGYPTGIGALLVRNTSSHVLQKSYFGGGTVQISLSSERFHVTRSSISDQFEDGTLSFLSIVALRHGFETLQSLSGTMTNITLHTFFLSRYVHHSLLLMHHFNGSPGVVLYSDTNYEDFSTQGNIVNFNLMRSNGEFIGFAEVLHFANLHGIHLRTGCFCNPGACQRHLNLSVSDLKKHFEAGHVCGDDMDLIEGKPTGSVRVSFGYMSTKQDADKLIDMIKSCFIDIPLVKRVPQWWPMFKKSYEEKFKIESSKTDFCSEAYLQTNEKSSLNANYVEASLLRKENTLQPSLKNNSSYINKIPDMNLLSSKVNQSLTLNKLETSDSMDAESNIKLIHIFLYPVKSCGPMAVNDWEISSRGLLYDREWMIVEPTGVALTQKREARLCLIKPTIDLENQCLILQYEGLSPVMVPLKYVHEENEVSLCESKVCGDYIKGWDCGDEVAEWLSIALGREGLRLFHQGTYIRTAKSNRLLDKSTSELSLANQAQFLLVNMASIRWLAEQLSEDMPSENLLSRFRCNFAVDAHVAFEELKWSHLQIADTLFNVEGPCTRCQMVCIDQQTGEKTKEPLKTLGEVLHGKLKFGVYLHNHKNTKTLMQVGDTLTICP